MASDDNSGMSEPLANGSVALLDPTPPNGMNGMSGAVRLTDWGLIRATGEDARNFLHGQLTQDITGLGESQARLAGYCTAKGRMQASFIIWAEGPHELWLACSADLLAKVRARLAMFVLRARCKLVEASAERALWGVAGLPGLPQPWQRVVRDGASWIGLPAALVDATMVPRALVATAPDAAPPASTALDADAWRWLEVASGVPRIVAATAEHFVPQMVNLELTGGVDFKKGCYPGQEVVARSQYRGTLKRRGFVLQGETAMAPSLELFHSGDPDQPAGEVMLAASWQGRHLAFAEMKLAAMTQGSLHLASADGPLLTARPLPYAIPLEQV